MLLKQKLTEEEKNWTHEEIEFFDNNRDKMLAATALSMAYDIRELQEDLKYSDIPIEELSGLYLHQIVRSYMRHGMTESENHIYEKFISK